MVAESRAGWFLAVDIGFTILALAFVSLRIGYRWSKRVIILSDWMIILAMFFGLLHMVLDIVITVCFGYGQHEADLPADIRRSYKTNIVFWLIQVFTKLPLLFSKVSLCLIYKDLLATADTLLVRISRVVNHVNMFLIVTFFTAMTLVSMFSCRPMSKIWYPANPGYCINNTAALYVTSAVNVLTSVLVIGTPLPVLFQTKHKRTEISQLIALVLLGVIDTVVSIVRLYMVKDLDDIKSDFTWLVIPGHTIIVIEYNITIIAASLVVMRLCFQAIFNRLFPNSGYNTGSRSKISRDSAYGGRSGYVMASSDRGTHERSDGARVDQIELDDGDADSKKGIVKTVDIEMSSRSASLERSERNF